MNENEYNALKLVEYGWMGTYISQWGLHEQPYSCILLTVTSDRIILLEEKCIFVE